MANAIVKVSPLDAYSDFNGSSVSLEERPFLGKVTLRGNPKNEAFLAAAKSALGVDLPLESSTFTEGSGNTVYWMGPDEWLVVAGVDKEHAIVDALTKAMDGIHAAIVNVSDYYACMRLSGPKARAVLEKGTHFDLHPRQFGPGQVAGTVFQHATITLAQINDTAYDIYVRWSYAEYMWQYLSDGATEYN